MDFKDIYMIFLHFSCRASSEDVTLGDEFEKYAWVKRDALHDYDLNEQTRDTFKQLDVLS
jgi:hypothetical protein